MPGPVAVLQFLLRPPVLALAGLAWVLSNRRRRRRFVLSVLAIMTAVVVLGELLVDHRHLPWRGLNIDDRAGLATGLKLRVLDIGPTSWCRDALGASQSLEVRPLDPWDGEGRCGWSHAYHIEKSGNRALTGSPPYAMQCALTAGAHIWITSADHHAQTILGSGLARVHHVGTYACRRMYNRSDGKMSQHAFANAWDVTGFELKDGRVISVLKHWSPRGDAREFLRAVHRDACRTFNIVLGPDYNAAHRDHFHVDMGGGTACR